MYLKLLLHLLVIPVPVWPSQSSDQRSLHQPPLHEALLHPRPLPAVRLVQRPTPATASTTTTASPPPSSTTSSPISPDASSPLPRLASTQESSRPRYPRLVLGVPRGARRAGCLQPHGFLHPGGLPPLSSSPPPDLLASSSQDPAGASSMQTPRLFYD